MFYVFPDETLFVSGGGKDIPGCGFVTSSACGSLKWLLWQIQKKHANSTRRLVLATDTNIQLNTQLMVKMFFVDFMFSRFIFFAPLEYVRFVSGKT